MTSKGVHASAYFLSRFGRDGGENTKKLEGKIKAWSRTRSQAIVCTSFFREAELEIGENCETLDSGLVVDCRLERSPREFAHRTVQTP
jgi:hypothetical protein